MSDSLLPDEQKDNSANKDAEQPLTAKEQTASNQSEEQTIVTSEQEDADESEEQTIIASEQEDVEGEEEQATGGDSESELPPEAQGELHGGPLGCCLGSLGGIFLTGLILVGAFLLLYQHPFVSPIFSPLIFVGAILGGWLGWRLGKKIYREYEPVVLPKRRRLF